MGNKVTDAARAAKERANSAAAKISKKRPKVVKEFAEFINKGNVIDLAVGVAVFTHVEVLLDLVGVHNAPVIERGRDVEQFEHLEVDR